MGRQADVDPHSIVRAFGSLAQEVMDSGVPGLVAMRYNVFVQTGAKFLVDLYAELAHARQLGEAVALGRKQLRAEPSRESAFEKLRLQDWSVPIVYEAAPLVLFSEPVKGAPLKIELGDAQAVPGRAQENERPAPRACARTERECRSKQ